MSSAAACSVQVGGSAPAKIAAARRSDSRRPSLAYSRSVARFTLHSPPPMRAKIGAVAASQTAYIIPPGGPRWEHKPGLARRPPTNFVQARPIAAPRGSCSGTAGAIGAYTGRRIGWEAHPRIMGIAPTKRVSTSPRRANSSAISAAAVTARADAAGRVGRYAGGPPTGTMSGCRLYRRSVRGLQPPVFSHERATGGGEGPRLKCHAFATPNASAGRLHASARKCSAGLRQHHAARVRVPPAAGGAALVVTRRLRERGSAPRVSVSLGISPSGADSLCPRGSAQDFADVPFQVAVSGQRRLKVPRFCHGMPLRRRQSVGFSLAPPRHRERPKTGLYGPRGGCGHDSLTRRCRCAGRGHAQGFLHPADNRGHGASFSRLAALWARVHDGRPPVRCGEHRTPLRREAAPRQRGSPRTWLHRVPAHPTEQAPPATLGDRSAPGRRGRRRRAGSRACCTRRCTRRRAGTRVTPPAPHGHATAASTGARRSRASRREPSIPNVCGRKARARFPPHRSFYFRPPPASTPRGGAQRPRAAHRRQAGGPLGADDRRQRARRRGSVSVSAGGGGQSSTAARRSPAPVPRVWDIGALGGLQKRPIGAGPRGPIGVFGRASWHPQRASWHPQRASWHPQRASWHPSSLLPFAPLPRLVLPRFVGSEVRRGR